MSDKSSIFIGIDLDKAENIISAFSKDINANFNLEEVDNISTDKLRDTLISNTLISPTHLKVMLYKSRAIEKSIKEYEYAESLLEHLCAKLNSNEMLTLVSNKPSFSLEDSKTLKIFKVVDAMLDSSKPLLVLYQMSEVIDKFKQEHALEKEIGMAKNSSDSGDKLTV